MYPTKMRQLERFANGLQMVIDVAMNYFPLILMHLFIDCDIFARLLKMTLQTNIEITVNI